MNNREDETLIGKLKLYGGMTPDAENTENTEGEEDTKDAKDTKDTKDAKNTKDTKDAKDAKDTDSEETTEADESESDESDEDNNSKTQDNSKTQKLKNSKTQDNSTALVPTTSSNEDKKKSSSPISTVLGGSENVLRKNWGLIAWIIVLSLVYTSNRYMAEQEMIRISDLQRELNEARYRQLTHSCDLTEQCRQSLIEERLHEAGDTAMHIAKMPCRVVRRK